MLDTVKADLRAGVDHTVYAGWRYWAKALGKATFAPNMWAIFLHRIAHSMRGTPLSPVAMVVRSVAVVLCGCEIHPDARLGPGFHLVHSVGVIVGKATVTGRNCRIQQNATLMAHVGDNVLFGAGSYTVGDYTIGDNAIVGANAVVLADVEPGMAVAGVPAKVVGARNHDKVLGADPA